MHYKLYYLCMTTLTIRLSAEQKRLIKTRAAYEGKTVTDLVLESTGVIKRQGTIHEAVKDLEEGRYQECNSLEELFSAIRSW